MKAAATLLMLALGLFSALGQSLAPKTANPPGQVVWWGDDAFREDIRRHDTNGVFRLGRNHVSNVVSISANNFSAYLMLGDGSMFTAGSATSGKRKIGSTLTNVAAIDTGNFETVAILRDGRVARWSALDWRTEVTDILPGLSNVVSCIYEHLPSTSDSGIFLSGDGQLFHFHFKYPGPLLMVDPRNLTNGVLELFRLNATKLVSIALVGSTPIALCADGSVLAIKEPSWPVSYDLPSAGQISVEPLLLNGKPLIDVKAIAGRGSHGLALKKNGTVVAWGDNEWGQSTVPPGLKNVVSIAAGPTHSLALKRDGTVVAWGFNGDGQCLVPAGLSNVVAIAASGQFSLAITTGKIPDSVTTDPFNELERMERDADIIFAGRVVSTEARTNGSFPLWAKPHATRFDHINILKGHIDTNRLTFWHFSQGPGAWGGARPPSDHTFELGGNYLIFAKGLDKSDYLLPMRPDAAAHPNEFRQLYSDGVFRSLNLHRLSGLTASNAVWGDLHSLLHDKAVTNQLYAIEQFDYLSAAGRRNDQWMHKDGFARTDVLTELLPFTYSRNETVACRALSCYPTETNPAVSLALFTNTLIRVANKNPFAKARLEAIKSLSGLHCDAVSNSAAQLLLYPDEFVRAGIVRLLPRFEFKFAERHLRESSRDKSPLVRSIVADVIGNEHYAALLPVLETLFGDPVGKDPLISPLTMEELKAGERWSNEGDVHTSAGMALMKFDLDQVAGFLKAHLDDEGFHISFVAKLAEKDAGPWLPELTSLLEKRVDLMEELAKVDASDPRKYRTEYSRVLTPAYARCWEDIRRNLLQISPDKLADAESRKRMDLLERAIRAENHGVGFGRDEAARLSELYSARGLTSRQTDSK